MSDSDCSPVLQNWAVYPACAFGCLRNSSSPTSPEWVLSSSHCNTAFPPVWPRWRMAQNLCCHSCCLPPAFSLPHQDRWGLLTLPPNYLGHVVSARPYFCCLILEHFIVLLKMKCGICTDEHILTQVQSNTFLGRKHLSLIPLSNELSIRHPN